jgi:outer membrane protein assembly factor BamB
MRRRQVLRLAYSSTIAGFAGCSVLGGDDEDETQPSPDEGNSGDGTAEGEPGEGTADGDDGSDGDGSSSSEDSQGIPVDEHWRTFQGDTANTGTGAGAVSGPSTDPSVDWTVTADDEMRGDPIIVDDTVLAGSWDNHLYAVSLSSGETRWSYELGDSLSYPAAAASGTVFVGGGTEVVALDIETGDPYWSTTLGSRVRGGAAVADGVVYVPTSENLVAIAAGNGDEQWVVRTGGPVASTPHATDEAVYFTSADGNIYAVDTDGENLWQQFISSSGGFPSPTVADGTVFFGWGDGNLYALDADDGTEQWTDKTGGAEVVAVADGVTYVAGYPLKAIDTDTQSAVWTTEEPEGLPTNFTVGTDRVYLGTGEARVFAYDKESGNQRWQFQADYEIETSVAISDGTLVYGNGFGTLVALS